MGELFEKDGFTASDGSIENQLNPLNGWRLPTKAEWDAIFGRTTRTGSEVNGSAGKYFARISLLGIGYAGISSQTFGILFFPDNEIISGKAFNYDYLTPMTVLELNAYLEQGCIFLPASGQYEYNGYGYWGGLGFEDDEFQADGVLWSSSEEKNIITFSSYDYIYSPESCDNKQTVYFPARLVKPV